MAVDVTVVVEEEESAAVAKEPVELAKELILLTVRF